MQRDLDSLLDIVQACRRLQRHIQGVDATAFLNDEKTQDAVIRQIEIIGEAAKRLSAMFRQSNPQLPWKEMAGMRDILIHQYDRVDVAEVWNAAVVDVPGVLAALEPLVPPEQP
jgi:uncharacterized protein with HEPN domain